MPCEESAFNNETHETAAGSKRDGDPRAPHKSSKFSRSSLVNAKKSLGEKKNLDH